MSLIQEDALKLRHMSIFHKSKSGDSLLQMSAQQEYKKSMHEAKARQINQYTLIESNERVGAFTPVRIPAGVSPGRTPGNSMARKTRKFVNREALEDPNLEWVAKLLLDLDAMPDNIYRD